MPKSPIIGCPGLQQCVLRLQIAMNGFMLV
jgi:hypothetical protein